MSYKRLAYVGFAMLVGSLSAWSGGDPVAEKLRSLQLLGKTIESLTRLANDCSAGRCNQGKEIDTQAINAKVERILGARSDSEFLFRVATFSYLAAYPQTAGLEKVDVVFDSAYRRSIERLRKSQSKEALASLVAIDHVLRLQGGEKAILLQTIESMDKALSAREK